MKAPPSTLLFLLLLSFVCLLNSTNAVPHEKRQSQSQQITSCSTLLRSEQAFCKVFLAGKTPPYLKTSTAVTSKTVTLATPVNTQSTTVTNTHTTSTPITVTQVVSAATTTSTTSEVDQTMTSTDVETSISTVTVTATAAQRKKRGITRPKTVARFTDYVIQEACFLVLYGTLVYPLTTTTTTLTSSTTPATSTTVTTISKDTTITNSFVVPATSTSFTTTDVVVVPSTSVTSITTTTTTLITNTQTTTSTPTSVSTPTNNGATCTGANSNVITCTYNQASPHGGLQSTFVAPCTGSMSVQLSGGNGGNDFQNGASASGESIESQIKISGTSTTIPVGTSFDVYVGGNGYSPYYENGQVAGGFNGGGAGYQSGNDLTSSAGGGGATDIRYQGNRLAVAGGGGGDGDSDAYDCGDIGTNDSKLVASGSQGQDATHSGSGGGGGGFLGGQQGDPDSYQYYSASSGCGAYSGSNLADTVLSPNGTPRAVITFTCSA